MSSLETVLPKKQSLLFSTSIVSLMTFLSRISGFARDMLIAQLFGAEAALDAFFIAFRIPNFMRRLFAEGAFSQAFVPVLSEYQQQRTLNEVRTFIARIAGRLIGILLLVTLLGVLASPLLVSLFAPGFGEDTTRSVLASQMLRITFPYLMLISLTAMIGAILNTYGYFAIPAITPVLLNLCMMAAAYYISPYCTQPVFAIAIGVLVAGILQFLFPLPFLWQKKLLVKPEWRAKDEGVTRVMKLMLPALFGVSVAQINVMVDSIFASFLQVGSVSWLYFTDRLTDFPLGVFGVAIATVILPHLSRHHAQDAKEHYARALDFGMRLTLLIGIPASIGLMLFSMPLIVTCFAYGKFQVIDVIQTQKSLVTLSLGVPAFMLIKVLAAGFYAKQDITTPVKVGVVAMLTNTFFCALFISPLAHAGLTLASSIAGYLHCFILLGILKRRGIYVASKGWLFWGSKMFFANAILVLYLLWVQEDISYWLQKSAEGRVLFLLQHTVTAGLLYGGVLYLLGIRVKQFRLER